MVAVTDEECAKAFDPAGAELSGESGLLQICDGADLVILGVVGLPGLPVLSTVFGRGLPWRWRPRRPWFMAAGWPGADGADGYPRAALG